MMQQHMHLVAYIQGVEDERLRSIINAYSEGNIERMVKIVMVLQTNTDMLQQHGWAYTMTCLRTSEDMLDDIDNIEGYKSFIEYVREDTYRVWRN